MEVSQELLSIVAIVVICVILAVIWVCVWFCRCRQDRIRTTEDKQERSIQLQQFEEQKARNNEQQATIRIDTLDVEKSVGGSFRSFRDLRDSEPPPRTMNRTPRPVPPPQPSPSPRPPKATAALKEDKIEERYSAANALQRVRESDAAAGYAKNKRLDTISEMAMSTESLQRNDSKTNVFNIEKALIEVDLNPGLNSSINLEKI